MPADQPLVRIFGIPVHVPFSGVLGVAVLAYLWAPAFDNGSGMSVWAIALAFAVLLSLATLVHEFAHALTARALGFPVDRVVLQLLGGVTFFQRRRESAMSEAAIAAAGPIATFAVAGLAYVVTQVADPAGVTATLARALVWANVVIGVYNSLPGLPLDGGNVLRCLVWAVSGSQRTGTVAAAWLGRGLAVLTLALPLILAYAEVVQPDLLMFLVCGLLGAMLWSGATQQLNATVVLDRAAGLTAAGLARRAIPVDRDLPLAEALHRAAQAGAGALVVVDAAGLPVGIGQPDAISAIPEARRPWVCVGAVSRPIGERGTIGVQVAGRELLEQVSTSQAEELLVLDPYGLVYGVLVARDLDQALRVGPRT